MHGESYAESQQARSAVVDSVSQNDAEPNGRSGQDRRDESRRILRDAVSQLMQEDGFQRWICVRSRFRRYSFGNCLLIAAQCPHATYVAGYKTWRKEFSRQVRRGERAIRIFAPIVRKQTDADTGDESRAVVGFHSACVFDVSQTDGEPLPEAPACAHADGDELRLHLPALEEHARELGYDVSYAESGSGALGFCDHVTRRIVVSGELSPNATVSTLVHELAHAHGLSYRDHARAECEVIVEAVTAIVLGSLGFDASSFSVPYIAGWASDEKGLEALERFAGTIDETARRLERALSLV